MSHKTMRSKQEAEEDDADEEAEETNGETETDVDTETKPETESEVCSISSSCCSFRVEGSSSSGCQQPSAASTDLSLLLRLERMTQQKMTLEEIRDQKIEQADDIEQFAVGETNNFKYRCYRSRSEIPLSYEEREQALELERKQLVKLELDRKREWDRLRERERDQERMRGLVALQEKEELKHDQQWGRENDLKGEKEQGQKEQHLMRKLAEEQEQLLQLDQSDYLFLDLEQESQQQLFKRKLERKQDQYESMELKEQLDLWVRESVEDVQEAKQQAPHVDSYPSDDQTESNNAEAQDDDGSESDRDEDEATEISRDDGETLPTTPYTYVNESPSDYRPGGYHPVSVGDSFQQRYFAISKLGWGHYSTVWLCYDTVRSCYCAIKLVKSAELYAESARHEIRLLRHISQLSWHPLRDRLVNMTDNFSTSGVNGTHQCLVFDVLGDNMLMLIQRSCYQGLPLYNVKQIAYQVLQGLYLLHDQGQLIHTDLKPENVLLVADELSLRSQATAESKKYLDTHQRQLSLADAKLSKTAKRRLRTKTKQSISFFQAHRKWLRERGIDDLLLLAKHGLLTTKMALDAVTNQLPYLAYDGPVIFSAAEVRQLRLSQERSSEEQVGDTQTSSRGRKRRSRMAESERGHNSGSGSASSYSSSKAAKMLQSSTEKFMRYVQKCIENDEKDEKEKSNESHHLHNKRMKSKKGAKKAAARRPADLPAATSSSGKLNMAMIERKDPALEPCKVRVAIADVGNACFVDQHVTEDIQTREYRAVEVILGAGYDTSADLWSAACLFWELATGEYLFEPNKWRGDASPDEVHIANIIETCGPIPRELIARGEYSAEIFNSKGELLNIKNLEPHPLHQVLMERYNWSPRDAHEFADFLKPMLCTSPQRRITAFSAINHPWLLLNEEDEAEQQDPNESHA
ncbi:SRSF protein kinase 2 [Drosophila mojavensis]|uniref:non-specific serine/threonine protein kinase n=1 Tax=Drosophila mojavensis TaxID=7230 RepID=B4L6Z6_DROMO|nr:SRSF protein kinase 2 [Drosophila mojavensis]EDW06142.1 uncharacterized protein Dmoj_GI16453 [Drosophila mojavensis]